MKFTSKRKGEAVWDGWSWVHIASGAALRIARIRWPSALGILMGFEALEAGLRKVKVEDGGGLFEYESWPNVAGDVLFGAVGYALADRGIRLWRRARRRIESAQAEPAVIVAVSRGEPVGRVQPTR